MTIQIEEGKFYAARDGRKIGPVRVNKVNHEAYPWTVDGPALDGDVANGWRYNGSFSPRRKLHDLDLVAEWVDEPAASIPELMQDLAAIDKNRATTVETLRSSGFTDAEIEKITERVSADYLSKTAEWAEQGIKLDGGKPPLHLIAPDFLYAVADILDFGAKKYAPRNWEKGMDWSRVYRAAIGHLFDWFMRKGPDPETGKSHLWHAACCIMFLVCYEIRNTGADDRPPLTADKPQA